MDTISFFQYTTLLIVSALPSVLIYRFLKENKALLEGTLLHSIRFTITGPIASYLVLLILSFQWVAPKLIPDPTKINITGHWKIAVKQGDKALFEEPTGWVSIFQKGTDVQKEPDVSLHGILTYRDSSEEDIIAEHGEVGSKNIYLLLERELSGVKDIAVWEGHLERYFFGDRLDGTYNLLLPESNQGKGNWEPVGRIVFKKPSWIVVYVIILLVPFIIFVALSKMLPPTQASVTGRLSGVIFRLGGPIAIYFVLVVISFLGYEKLFLSPEAKGIYASGAVTSFDISGKWNMVYKQIILRGTQKVEEEEGRGVVTITQDGTKVDVKGDAMRKGRNVRVSWRSRFGRVTDDGYIFFYYELLGGTGDRGVLFGNLQQKKPDTFFLNWFDFKKSPEPNIGTCYYTRVKQAIR